MKIRRQLAEKNPDAYLPDLATSCNNLAALLHTFGSFKEAEKLYREAFEILRDLAKDTPKAYLSKLKNLCDKFTILLEKTGRREEAGSLRREVAEFYQKQLAQQ